MKHTILLTVISGTVKHLFFVIVLLLALSCSRAPSRLEQALRLAGDNRAELERVLAHYSQSPADSLHYRAAVHIQSEMLKHVRPDK